MDPCHSHPRAAPARGGRSHSLPELAGRSTANGAGDRVQAGSQGLVCGWSPAQGSAVAARFAADVSCGKTASRDSLLSDALPDGTARIERGGGRNEIAGGGAAVDTHTGGFHPRVTAARADLCSQLGSGTCI